MDKWTRKYLKLARTLAEDNTACHSRHIGVVLVGVNNRILSMGYNGSVEGVPHNDDPRYLSHLYRNLLTPQDRQHFADAGVHDASAFVVKYSNCKVCPRRLVNAKSGERLELCGCAHAERNALASASRNGVSTENSTMYCYCSVPCHECTTQIIQSGVKEVVCLHQVGPDYSPSSRGLFEMSGVKLRIVDIREIDQ